MWIRLTAFIIRNRVRFIVGILLVTAGLGWFAKDVQLSYDTPAIVPQDDPDYAYYNEFRQQYGLDNNVMVIGMQERDVFQYQVFNDWQQLSKDLAQIEGVQNVAGLPQLLILSKDTATDEAGEPIRRFILVPFADKPLQNQEEADSLKQLLADQPFYRGLFYNDTTHATLLAVNLTKEAMQTKLRSVAIDSVQAVAQQFGQKYGVNLHYSGLPFIRTKFSFKVKDELNLFLGLSVAITSIILLLFFKSLSAVIFPLSLISIITVWTMGIIVLLGYKLNLLTGLIPPLIVIIAVPNFIYFLNRYHTEYRKYQNRFMAITRMVNNIAQVIFLNNITTAIGFGVMVFVNSPMLKEFGLVAFIMITLTYFATLILLPVVFSYLPVPNVKQTKYMDSRAMMGFLNRVIFLAEHKRGAVFSMSIALVVAGVVLANRLQAVGYIMDDIPQRDRLSTDLGFFDRHFKGIMPFEMIVDTERKNGVMNVDVLQKIADIQDSLQQFDAVAGSLSIADVASYARQAFYNGMPEAYQVPSPREQGFLRPYLSSIKIREIGTGSYALTDTAFSQARITVRMQDVGSVELARITEKMHEIVPQVLHDEDDGEEEEEKIGYRFTGFSTIFLKGTGYLVGNLWHTILLAVSLITAVIAWLFRSVRLVLITILPNCLALLITAAIMGAFEIPLKVSTVLVFSVAFGIAIDSSFHFLVRYRQDLRHHNWDIKKTVAESLRETGLSIVYTQLVLLAGFGIFIFSSFGSTISLGLLTCITLFTALFTNIVLIPALLVAFDRKPRQKMKSV